MIKLPPLPKVRDLGGDEFERLMHQLLKAHAERHNYEYEPHGKPGAADGGIDGLARGGGVPGFKGPVAFQFKWLCGNLSRGDNAKQIEASLTDAVSNEFKLAHYVVVTPENLSPARKKWLVGLPKSLGLRTKLKVHHWGHTDITSLFRLRPDLLTECYPGATADQARQELLAGYLAWLIKDSAPLKLRAIDQGAARSGRKPLGLTSVYVDLELTLRLPEKRSLLAHLAKPQLEMPGAGRARAGGEEAKSRRVAVLEALAAHPRLVLLGAPGSGKSTLAAYLALSLAEGVSGRKKPLARLGPWWKSGALPPVPVVLREFAASLPKEITKGRARHLWDFLEAELARKGLPGQTTTVLRDLAGRSGVLFLLDGLDEARETSTRRRVLEAVTEFAAAAGPNCRFVLTTRPYAWEQATAAQVDWPAAYRLADFSPEQIETFIGHWFEAVRSLGWIGEAEADEKTANLRQAVQRPDLQPLASNPLLLTLMATLLANRYRLPDDRADLYDEVVKLLLQRWSEASGADRGLLDALALPGLTLDHLREVMQQLAYEAHAQHAGQEGVASIHEGELLAALRPLLGEDLGKAGLALEYIEKRAGLLLGQGPRGHERQYTFPHRTFQEFLAACWLADQPDFCTRGVDLARANPAHWREVLTFAARQAKVGRGVPAADALVHHQSVEEWTREHPVVETDWRVAVLAGEQLLEMGLAAVGVREEHRVIRRRVAGWLGALLNQGALPVAERDKAGKALARLGDERPGVGVKNGLPDIAWIEIPPGPFKMGEGKEQFDCALLTRPYRISRYPVTVAQYQAFVDDGGYGEERFRTTAGWRWRQSAKIAGPEDYDPMFQMANHPRVGVSWYEAIAFCAWLTQELRSLPEDDPAHLPSGLAVSLPNEPEWERAARHTNGRKFPWGDEGQGIEKRCNIDKTGLGHTSAVGMFSVGLAECGAADMAGNVWEWTRSLWGNDPRGTGFEYPYVLEAKRENLQASGRTFRIFRGGSWNDNAPCARCACRNGVNLYARNRDIGFRLVASPFFPLNSGISDL